MGRMQNKSIQKAGRTEQGKRSRWSIMKLERRKGRGKVDVEDFRLRAKRDGQARLKCNVKSTVRQYDVMLLYFGRHLELDFRDHVG